MRLLPRHDLGGEETSADPRTIPKDQIRPTVTVFKSLFLSALLGGLLPLAAIPGQVKPPVSSSLPSQTSNGSDSEAEMELRRGIDFTRAGSFQQAIPHLLAARGHVGDEYAASFNLALCYVAIGQYQSALPILKELESRGQVKSEVYSLNAQALIGADRLDEAFDTFQKAVELDPGNERLYLFVADACMDNHQYSLGLRVLDTGLQHFPDSPRLHYEKGVFYSFVDEPDKSESELLWVVKKVPGSVIASLAAAQRGLLDGDIPATIQSAREGVQKDPDNYILLAILGQALIKSGVGPGQAEFDEARTALEKSVALRDGYWVSQLELGKIFLMANRADEAITHLEIARRLSPETASVYSFLARAYRQRGDTVKAQKMLSELGNLNQARAAKYKLAPPDHMASYMGTREH